MLRRFLEFCCYVDKVWFRVGDLLMRCNCLCVVIFGGMFGFLVNRFWVIFFFIGDLFWVFWGEFWIGEDRGSIGDFVLEVMDGIGEYICMFMMVEGSLCIGVFIGGCWVG